MKKRPNLLNFFYLVGSGLIIQLSGSVYRIWLARKVGPESLGILQMVYPVYRLLSGLATLGLSLAVTKWVSEYLVSKNFSGIISIRKWAARMVLISSILAAVLLMFFTPLLSKQVFTDPRVCDALFVIAIAIPFSALSAIYRGYFQGFSRTAPTAVSEIAEQLFEVGTTYFLVCIFAPFLPFSLYTSPLFGLTVGEIVCLITLSLFLRFQALNSSTINEVMIPRPEILRYSWPLLLNQLVTSVSLASEGVIIPSLLIQSHCTTSESTGLFGQLTGMAEPVAYFPLIFMTPLASVLSPQVSSAFKTGSFAVLRRKIALFYLTATVLCLIGYFCILFTAAPLAQFLYGGLVKIVARLIKIMVIGLPFTGIAILDITILAAVGATDKILYISLWVAGLKTFLLYILIPPFGIYGAAWAINITQIFIALVSMKELWPYLPQSGGIALPKLRPPFRSRAESP